MEKRIDIQEMLQVLETQIKNVELFLETKKRDGDRPKKDVGLFDIFESDYNDITLDKKFVIGMFENISKKVRDLRLDVEHCGVQFFDFKKASSDYYIYCQKRKDKIEKDTQEYGLYQRNLTEQFRKNVNRKMVDVFNNTFTDIKTDKYFHNYKRCKGGNISQKNLFDIIYSEVSILPSHRNDDFFDEKGHFLGLHNTSYDTSMVTRESVNTDTDNIPLFTFQYKRNIKGHFECLRVKIGSEWFVLYEQN